MISKNTLSHLRDQVAMGLPWPQSSNRMRCFINMRPGVGGPAGFVAKLTHEFNRDYDVQVSFGRLQSARAALLVRSSPGNWFYRLCRQRRIRTVARVNGFYVPSYFDNRIQPPGFQSRQLTPDKLAVNYRMQRDLAVADFIIYQSLFCKELADHYLYHRRSDYTIIYNGVDLDHFRPASRRGGRRRVLVAGTLRHEYMLGTVLPVFERIWQQHELDLLIVGPLDRINRRLLETFHQDHPRAASNVSWVGPVSNREMAHYMQLAHVLLHPRLGDWCPNVVVEAMACGLPVVCGSWGGTAELVGDAGRVVPVGPWAYGEPFVEALALAVAQVLDSPESYAEAARRRAETLFDMTTCAGRYLEALGLLS